MCPECHRSAELSPCLFTFHPQLTSLVAQLLEMRQLLNVFNKLYQGFCLSLPRGKGMEILFTRLCSLTSPEELHTSVELPEDAQGISDHS